MPAGRGADGRRAAGLVSTLSALSIMAFTALAPRATAAPPPPAPPDGAPAADGAPVADGAPAAVEKGTKRSAGSARLLLPFFLVDSTDAQGPSTYFSVRNESLASIEIEVSYFATDRPSSALRTDRYTLTKKQLRSFDVRSVLADLLIDDDGFARGYVVVENLSGEPVIQGETFQLDPDQGFASSVRLLDVDPDSPHNDLCSFLSLRFFNGGLFTGGTVYTVWLSLDEPPDGVDPVLEYSVYRESGKMVFHSSFHASEVAFQVRAEDLVSISPISFGVIEFEFPNTVGAVVGTLSADGQYSVGVEAACGD